MIYGGRFAQGETITFLAGVTLGDVDDVTGTPAADLKAMYGGVMPRSDSTVVAVLDVTASAATADAPAGWTITITDEQTEALEPGAYVLDVRCAVGSGVYISDPLVFIIDRVVTIR